MVILTNVIHKHKCENMIRLFSGFGEPKKPQAPEPEFKTIAWDEPSVEL